MTMGIIIGIGIFVTIVLFIEASYLGLRKFSESETRTIKKRLRTLSAGGSNFDEIDLVRKRMLSELPWLNRLLLSITRLNQLDRLIEQANASLPLSFFILLSLLLAALGFASGMIMRMHSAVAIVFAVILGAMPFLYLLSLKKKRMAKFQEQLPDALDLVARSLRAGHAFSGGLKMVAEEFGDPVGTEFQKTLDEINFGVGVDQAMKNLAHRVDCPDLQFFTVSVIIQRESGGNLAEILEKIASLVRERFKLYGKVKALSAEGKLSAIVLLSLPPCIALYMFFVSPDYIGLLIKDHIGIVLLISAVCLMFAGVVVMKRMINIRV
jgi:tight adherence protein B